MKQVRATAAVGSTKPGQGNAGRGPAFQNSRPVMLVVSGPLREPDLSKRGVTAQVVDVPVWEASSPAVMGKPPRQSSGPAGATHIGIEAGLNLEPPEGAYPDTAAGRRFEDEDVGTGFFRYGGV